MPESLLLTGAVSGLVAVTALGGAIRETLKMSWATIAAEPIPTHLLQTIDQLGGDHGQDNSSGTASS